MPDMDMTVNTKIILTGSDNDTLELNSETGLYQIGSCSVTLQENKSGTFTFDIGTIYDKTLITRFPEQSTKVDIRKGPFGSETQILVGQLKSKPAIYDDGAYDITLEGVNYIARLQGVLVNEAYQNQTISFIAQDLHDKYIPEFPVDYIQDIDMRLTVVYKDKYLYDVFEDLANMLFWTFTITPEMKFQFCDPKTITNPNVLTVNDVEMPVRRETDTSRLINRLRVQGPNKPSMDQTQYWEGDGQTTAFSFPVKRVLDASAGKLEFYVWGPGDIDWVLTPIGTKYLQNYSETVHYLLNTNDACIEADAAVPLGVKLKCVYQYKYPLIFYMDDKTSQSQYGIITKKIRVDSLDSVSAQLQAQTYLNRFCRPFTKAVLRPFTGFYFPGQMIELNMPEVELVGLYRITSVVYNGVYENDVTITVESGG